MEAMKTRGTNGEGRRAVGLMLLMGLVVVGSVVIGWENGHAILLDLSEPVGLLGCGIVFAGHRGGRDDA